MAILRIQYFDSKNFPLFTDEVEGALSRRRTAGLDLEYPQSSFGKVYAEADRFKNIF